MNFFKKFYIQMGIFCMSLVVGVDQMKASKLSKLPISSENLYLIFPMLLGVCFFVSWQITPIVHMGLLQFEFYKKMCDEDCVNQCLRIIKSQGGDKKLIAEKILKSVINNNHH